VVECTALERRHTARCRGFESLSLLETAVAFTLALTAALGLVAIAIYLASAQVRCANACKYT
jgi:hypothetical protein